MEKIEKLVTQLEEDAAEYALAQEGGAEGRTISTGIVVRQTREALLDEIRRYVVAPLRAERTMVYSFPVGEALLPGDRVTIDKGTGRLRKIRGGDDASRSAIISRPADVGDTYNFYVDHL